MEDFRTTVIDAMQLLNRNRKYALMYVGAILVTAVLAGAATPSVPGAQPTPGNTAIIAIIGIFNLLFTLVIIYIKSGLLGCLKQDVIEGRASSFKDFNLYAKKYFLTLLGILILIAVIIGLSAAVVIAAVIIMNIAMQSDVNMAQWFQSSGDSYWAYVLVSLGGAISGVWTAGAVSYSVYHEKEILPSLKGGLSAVFANWRVFTIFIIYVPFSALFVKLIQHEFVLLRLLLGSISSVVSTCIILFAYAAVMQNFKKSAWVAPLEG